jgi:hypothetical protein
MAMHHRQAPRADPDPRRRVRAKKGQPRGALQKVRPQQQRQIGNLIESLAANLTASLYGGFLTMPVTPAGSGAVR